MKYLNILILFLMFFFTSCKDKEKYIFIQNVFNNPENIEEYLEESNFDWFQFKHFFLVDSTLKRKKIETIHFYKTNYITNNFHFVEYNHKSYILPKAYKDTNSYEMKEIIMYNKPESRGIIFRWYFKDDLWHFFSLDFFVHEIDSSDYMYKK